MPRIRLSQREMPRLILLLLLFTPFLRVQASHIMAGDLTYRHLGGSQYEVTLKLYRDCGGIPLGPTAWVQLSSSCGADSNLTLNLLAGSGQELPLLCPAEQPNSSCNGGSLLGVREFVYTDTVLLGMCSDWTFTWSSCCRNAAISNLQSPSSRGVTLLATLNNSSGPNSSPVFSAIPTPYICVNQPFSYSQGAAEADGDSLVFRLADPLENALSPIPFAAGFSKTQPFSPAMTFDSLSGAFQVTPNGLQVAVLAIEVEEYRNGLLIGSTRRDLQVIVLNCNNTFPQLDPDSARFLSPLAVQTGRRSIEVCPGNLVSFSLQAGDADPGDSVFIGSNAATAFSGASFSSSPGPGSATASFSWTPGPGDVGSHLLELVVRDNHCPLLGVQRYAVLVTVLSRTTAGPDRSYCPAGGPVKLQASGGSSFTWTYLGGGTPPLSELSCNNCPAPLASPAVTTTYVVSSDLANCLNQDTVTVTVVPDFLLTLIANPEKVCRGDSVQLLALPFPAGNYTYSWTPGTLSPDSAFTKALPFSGTRYHLSATNANGCRITDSVDIEVVSLSLNAAVTQDKVCRLDSTTFLGQASSNQPYALNWFDPLGAVISNTDTFRYQPLLNGYYRVQAADTGGVCFRTDSVRIDVLDLDASPDFSSLCPGDSVQLNALFTGPVGFQYPLQCGPAPDSCCGPRYTYLLGDSCAYDSGLTSPGNGSRNCALITPLYSPYQPMVGSARLQYLFRRSELHAAGFLGGSITQLRFFLAYAYSQGNDTLQEMVIKLGCTDEDSLTTFAEGLTTVWGPRPYVPATGFNLHLLDRPFDWDGSGNLIVQICSKDDSTVFSGAGAVYMTTSFPSVLRGQGGVSAPLCEIPASDTAFFRPFTEFGVCVEGIAPRYEWHPAIGLSDPYIANPMALPPGDTVYTVTVRPADGCLCELKDSVRVETGGCILEAGQIHFFAEKTPEGVALRWKLEAVPGTWECFLERNSEGDTTVLFREKESDTGTWQQHLDRMPDAGLNLYRIGLKDKNGGLRYSGYREVVWSHYAPRVFPNPVNAGANIRITGMKVESLTWRDLAGRLLSERAHGFAAPSTPGLYLLEAVSGNSRVFFKVRVQ